ISLAYNHFRTDGYRQNNAFQRDGLLLTSAVRLGGRGKLDLLVNHIDYTAHIPSSLNRTDLENNPTKADPNWLAAKGHEANKYSLIGLTYTHGFKGSLRNSTSVFYSYLDHYEPRPFDILNEFTHGFGLRTLFTGKLFEGDFVLGGEIQKDEYHWNVLEDLYESNNGLGSLGGEILGMNLEFRRQFNLFGSYGIPLAGKITAQVGLNLNQTVYDFRDLFNTGTGNRSGRRDFSPILSPSFQLQYPFDAGHLYASASRGFSNPGLEESLNPEGVVNPDISQEKGMSYELGGEFGFLDRTLVLGATLYLMHIKDLLVADRVGDDQYIGRNAGKTRHRGLELEARYDHGLSKRLSIRPFLAYTLGDHNFVEFHDGDNDYSGNPLTGVPKHRISSGLDVVHTHFGSLHFTHQYVDGIPLNDANTVHSDAYNLFNLSARSTLALSQRLSLKLVGGANNLLDTGYASSVLINAVGFGGNAPRYFYPGNGRNFYASLGFTYMF